MRGLHCVPLLLLLTAGCWQARYFTPRENLNGTGPDGRPAALYKVQEDAATQSHGDVRIWSAGAKARFVEDDKEVVELHVGFEIENTGKVPLELVVDSLALEELFVDGYLQDVMAPNSTNGSGLAAPGSTARLHALFRPKTTYPSDVDSFSVRFVVRDAGGKEVSQVTPFVPGSRWRQVRTVNDPTWGSYVWGPGGFGWGPYYGWGGFYGGGFYGGRFCR